MKKYFYLAMALCMGFAMTSCDDDDENEPQVPAEQTATLTFEGDYWTALIDNPQYNGPLLYGENSADYAWTDELTSLSGGMTNGYGDGKYWGGGTAISNYIDADIENHNKFDYQLAVPESNGSENFAVVYCDATIRFPEGVKHVVKSMDISPTTYVLGTEVYGDGYAASLAESGNLTITFTADNGKTMDIDLARDGNILKTWKTFDLSELGEVNSISFTMDGSDKSEYGVKHPKGFAFDNVVVKMK